MQLTFAVRPTKCGNAVLAEKKNQVILTWIKDFFYPGLPIKSQSSCGIVALIYIYM